MQDIYRNLRKMREQERASYFSLFFIWAFLFLYRILRSLAIRILPRRLIDPRVFSNEQLRKYGASLDGDIINVSGWDDNDSAGGYYHSYFPKHARYVISNAKLANRGFGSVEKGGSIEEVALDLNFPIPKELEQKFDVVFSHTVLEHIQNFEQAFKNHCHMSRDAVMIVVPGIQQIHFEESYGDYWRPTPMLLAKLFQEEGFTPLVITTNDQPFMANYIFAFAVRDAKKYADIIESHVDLEMGSALFGSSLHKFKKNIPDILAQQVSR